MAEFKKCTSCKKTKKINEFCKNKRVIGGIHYSCKQCNNERKRKEKGIFWKAQLKKQNKKYCPKCDTVKHMDEFTNVKTNSDGKFGLCKVCKTEAQKKYIKKLKKNGIYKKIKKEEYLRNIKTYKNHTKNRVRDYKKEYKEFKKSELRMFKQALRSRTYQAFKYRDIKKDKLFSEILGCSFECAKKHIEDQFDDKMNWNNYGEWHIDHIKPLAQAKNKKELEDLCHYLNLQPLWAKDNLSKGSKY